MTVSGNPLPTHVDDITCTGNEVKLTDCPHRNGTFSCPGCNSAGVHCKYDIARKFLICFGLKYTYNIAIDLQ